MKETMMWDMGNFSETDFNSSEWYKRSAWWGHHFFAYDLITNTKPRVVVELGTHWGFSFFNFCQAVSDLKLKTELHAIDSWEGDPQAGLYGKEVFDFFSKTAKDKFSDVNIHVHKGYFDSFLNSFPEKSIDLLHIDGLHTYEAVKKDFDDWLPKISKDGIILLHDTHVHKADFGVWQLWQEIKEKYTTSEFFHSHGLGVVFLGGKKLFGAEEVYAYQRKYEDSLFGMIQAVEKKSDGLTKKIADLEKINKKQTLELDKLNKILLAIRDSRIWKVRNKIAKTIRRGQL